jgi:prophage DNA circulation protein
MSTIKERLPTPWRRRLVPASFRGAQYFVEEQARSSGRRTVTHEYPKRDKPYSEDMGRHAVRYNVTGYIIGPSYHVGKGALMRALDQEGGGQLIDPYLPLDSLGYTPLFVCERYSYQESRERGAYVIFSMVFVEEGEAGNAQDIVDTADDLNNRAVAAVDASAADMNAISEQLQRPAVARSPLLIG